MRESNREQDASALTDTDARLRDVLRATGLDAYEVGGAVRDELMGRAAKDRDIVVCGATPDELQERLRAHGSLAELSVDNGRECQHIGFVWKPPWGPVAGFEIALARTEVSTGPRYQDFAIRPDPSVGIAEDLRRRDFTCNAIARSVRTGKLIDPFGGRADIAAGVLRAITADTLRDDPLRTMRAVARCAEDGSSPAARTREQMQRWAGELTHLPAERSVLELRKALLAPHAAHGLRIASRTGVLEQLIPAWAAMRGFDQGNPYHELTVDEHTLLAIQHATEIRADDEVIWAMLLHDIGKPMMAWSRPGERTEDGRPRLRFHGNEHADEGDPSSQAHEWHSARYARELLGSKVRRRATPGRLPVEACVRDHVPYLCEQHMFTDDASYAGKSEGRRLARARTFLVKHGAQRARWLLDVRRCDRAAKHPGSPTGPSEVDSSLFAEYVERELARGFPLAVSELALKGGELAELGAAGPGIGSLHRELLDRAQRSNDPHEFNTPERLTKTARKILGGEPSDVDR